MATKSKITVRMRDSKDAEATVRDTFSIGPKNLLRAIDAVSEAHRESRKHFGLGTWRYWVEVDGVEIDTFGIETLDDARKALAAR